MSPLASAVQVVAALRDRGHTVHVVDTARGPITERDEMMLVPAKVGIGAADHRQAPGPPTQCAGRLPREIAAVKEAEVIFLALHGGQGEDGTVQAVLDVIGIPYTGSGPLASALAMDKDLSKKLFAAAGVPVASWLMAPALLVEVEAKVGFPCVVKPSKQGSTVGLTVVKAKKDLAPAIELAYQFDDEVMIEAFIAGRELTVGCSTASPSRSARSSEARDLRLRVQVPAGDVGGDLPAKVEGWDRDRGPAPLGAGAPGAQARQLLADRFPA